MNIFIFMHAVVLLFICGAKGQPNLEIIVTRKVKEFGQNLKLFCKIDNCCPKDAGWTVDDALIFIDIKRFIQKIDPNSSYDATYGESGMTLVIKNFTISDLNKTYECTYDFYSVRKCLLYDDVFSNSNLEIIVNRKVKAFGQNLQLFCKIDNCCPKDAGWTVEDALIFTDIKRFIQKIDPNSRYDATYGESGMTLVIKNFSISDLNKTYECTYDFYSVRKSLLYDDVFSKITPDKENRNDSPTISGSVIGIVIGTIVGGVFSFLLFLFCIKARGKKLVCCFKRKETIQHPVDNTEMELLQNTIHQDSGRPSFNTESHQVDEAAMEPLQHIDNQQDSDRPCFNRDIQQVDEAAMEPLQHIDNQQDSGRLSFNRESQQDEQEWSELFTKIAPDIVSDWKRVGRMLGIPNSKINIIDKDTSQSEEKAYSMLQEWRNSKGSSATSVKLIHCLNKLNLKRVAEIVEEHFKIDDTKVEIKEVVDTGGWSKLFHIISIEISITELRGLGLNLGFAKNTVDCIDQDNCDTNEKIFALLQQWLDRNGRSATKEHLVRALKAIENERVAEIVEKFQLENNAIE